MAWFRLDDQGAFHEKVIAAGNEAYGAWCRAGQWSSGRGTEGLVPKAVALSIAPAKVWKKLIDAKGTSERGLVEASGDDYQIHDFLDWNPTADEVVAKRKARAEAGRKGGLTKAANGKQTPSKRLANAKQTASKPSSKDVAKLYPVPDPDPDPTKRDPPLPPSGVGNVGEPGIPKSEVLTWGSHWLDEYKRIAEGLLRKRLSWDTYSARKALDRLLMALCPCEFKANPVEWFELELPDFIDTARAKPGIYSVYAPAGFERWLNEQDTADDGPDPPPRASEVLPVPGSRTEITEEQRQANLKEIAELEAGNYGGKFV